jgi:biofilm PGA synthesis N-glycosyltransferase PgaC
METVFWASFAVVAYVYVGYPMLLAAWARVRPAPRLRPRSDAFTPDVSIVLAARNEAARLPGRIDNLLQMDYPGDRRQIVVVSDGSSDGSMSVLSRYPNVDAVQVAAGGKALAVNAGVALADRELLVFADARQAFAPDALRELVAPFQDPEIGAVTGELLLDAESPGRRVATRDRRVDMAPAGHSDRRARSERRRTVFSTIADGVGLYWRYEKSIRHFESAIGSTTGVTGAIYAMRRSLWRPLPAGAILDDVLTPLRLVMAGYRVVFSERARAFDRTAPDAHVEARRKIRTLAGNYQLLCLEPRLLLPWRNPVFLQFVSHKLGRLVVPYALVALIASSMTLAGRSPLYAAALAGQCLFYLLAAYGAWLEWQDERAQMSGAVHA